MKYGIAILCAITLPLLSGCGAFKKSVSIEERLKGTVVDINGKTVSSSHLDTDYLLLYFSAHWCPPCQTFTPKLVDFYHANGGGELFKVVLISSDHNETAMFDYMRKTRMPWPAVKYGSESVKGLSQTYSGDGIPRLVLINPKGTVLTDSFKGRTYVGPEMVLEKLKKRLEKQNPDPAEPPDSTGETLPTPEQLANKFKINGFGQGTENQIAIINGQFASVGAELEEGIVVESITPSYVVVSYEGNLYQLFP